MLSNDRIKQAPDKKTAFALLATGIAKANGRHVSNSFIEALPITKRDPVSCYADGFAEGIAFALQGVAEGKINMKLLEVDQ